MLYQQGDVLIETCDSIPSKSTRKTDNHLAEGEATGHFHAVSGGGAAVLECGEDLFVDAPGE